jgi:hypothetical protein
VNTSEISRPNENPEVIRYTVCRHAGPTKTPKHAESGQTIPQDNNRHFIISELHIFQNDRSMIAEVSGVTIRQYARSCPKKQSTNAARGMTEFEPNLPKQIIVASIPPIISTTDCVAISS